MSGGQTITSSTYQYSSASSSLPQQPQTAVGTFGTMQYKNQNASTTSLFQEQHAASRQSVESAFSAYNVCLKNLKQIIFSVVCVF